MRKPLKASAALLLSMVIIATAESDSLAKISVGEPYPDFVLPSINDRKPVALSDFRGKKVLLIQFASW